MTNTPPTSRYNRIKAELKQTSVTLRRAALPQASDAQGDGWPEADYVPSPAQDASQPSVPSDFLRTL